MYTALNDLPQYFTEQLVDSLVKTMFPMAMDYVGGMPTSAVASGQQWDFPYAWSPLEYFIFDGLQQTNSTLTNFMSMDIIQRWVTTNYCGETLKFQDCNSL
ncbi:hypothetical protein SAMD00019534_035880 [Acytostelium subglobosum LB1]|uniref:hypothetical protein n=1 Tax=Acytostelium subglobosum LB1 TaxID=1410327 RepID=UPI000644DED0|nr:hypothetical protein SAMD00019534_035880 [Acytostelium subglobosum LB1]GAM20413.1 hypothetical protein SAMD00019534_035880 [Acytostelium subglobosum LB1]|eukprot:XP_012759934.1 hypothetical protein SAMD00019534_035880 [Acytostelium subglobosum LB1]